MSRSRQKKQISRAWSQTPFPTHLQIQYYYGTPLPFPQYQYEDSMSISKSSSKSKQKTSIVYPQSQIKPTKIQKRRKINHYKYKIGQKIREKYQVKKLLGDGTFGRVLECECEGILYAIKIIKLTKKYGNAAKAQSQTIMKINQIDFNDLFGIVRYVDSFYHKKHYCLVFKPLGMSLASFILMNSCKGFPLKYVQSFARQILQSFQFLHRIGYTHTDLKPSNILLQSPQFTQNILEQPSDKKYYTPNRDKIRIIDFGGATRYNQNHSPVITTRQYRSPEVILQCCQWNQITDIWSIGCIICQLYAGYHLFQVYTDKGHLIQIGKYCGRFPNWMTQNTIIPNLKKLFRHGYVYEQCEEIQSFSFKIDAILEGHTQLIQLVQRCLEINPRKRISARQALRLPFFQLQL